MDSYWIPHKEFVFLPCAIEKKSGETVNFVSEDGTKITLKTSDLPGLDAVHGEQLKGVDDICALSVVCEAAMLHTVRIRYMKKEVYTNVAKILIAMNPFAGLPIYNKEYMDKYSAANSSDLPPHIYGIGQDAMQGIRTGFRDQAILISGESGAGKTESAKLVLSYVAEVLKGKHGGIEEQLLRTNPILESFGNAMTSRNNNSSRFGKWLDIQFDALKMNGVSLTSYLLEVTRVCAQAKGERNYHVFFQLLRARESTKLGIADMRLGEPKKYRYVKDSQQSAPGIDDGKCFADMTDAFTALKFEKDTQKEICRILGGILVLGNCDFKDDNDEAKLIDVSVAKHAAELFQVDVQALTKCMTHKKITVGKDDMDKPIRGDQAPTFRDSISRKIYGRLFLWLIQKINGTLATEGTSDSNRLLGVLDIAGFESFEINSLEQLLINLSNEHLQQQFNNMVFKSEIDDYAREGISLGGNVQFTDNSDVLELLDSKGSVLDMLDEAVALPKCTDMQYSQNVVKAHDKHPRLVKPKFAGKAIFGVKHYAGEVMYTCDGFLEKNADKPPDALPGLLQSSEMQVLKMLGQEMSEEEAAGKTGPGQKKKAKTAASGFRTSLRSLMTKINAADPHYIRCIKPNSEKVPDKVTSTMVYQQLLFSGVFDSIKIRKQGYGSRMPFGEFISRYGCVVNSKIRKELKSNTQSDVKQLAGHLKMAPDSFQVGNTKILLKQSAMNSLELAREAALVKPCIHIQSCWRRYKAKKTVKEAKDLQRELRAWLKQSSVFDDKARDNAAKNKKRFTVKEVSTSAFKRLGSPEAVEASLAQVKPLLERVEKIKSKFSSPLVLEASKTKQRMQMEMDSLNELKGLATSIDPVRLDKAMVRCRDLGLPDTPLTSKMKDRIGKLQVQIPLTTAMRSVIEAEGSDEQQLIAVMEGLQTSGFKDRPEDWIEELHATTLLSQVQELWKTRPELHGKKAEKAVPGARKTVTGFGPVEQAKILHNLSEAADQYDVEALEALLHDAMKHGIAASAIEPSQKVYQDLHTEDFVTSKVHELVAQKADKKVLKQLQNLAKQVRLLQGDTELYNLAASAAQKVGRKTLATNELIGSIFDDLSSYQGLKPTTLETKDVSLVHTIQGICEALSEVPDELEGKAVQNFRNIMIGMYDKPASDIEVMSARQAVMELACSEGGLRNEIYIQAMKQITANPSERSVLMGWQLLRFLCQASPPRPDLMEFVEAFANRALASGLTGVPDERFLKAAGIAEEDWAAYTVDVSREATDCLAALARPQSWVLASAPNSSTVALQAKAPNSGCYGNQLSQSQPGHVMGAMSVEDPRYAQQQGVPANKAGSCADRCSNCVVA